MKRRATKLAIAMALALSATATMAACDAASMKEGFGGFVDTVVGFAGEEVSNAIKDGFNGIVDKIFPSEEPEVPEEPVEKEVTVTLNDGTNTTTKKVTVGEAYDLGTPSKTGYTFGGWYNGDTLVPPTGTWAGEADVTLTAKWTAVEYAITYQGVEGENTNPAKYTVEDEDITLVAPAAKVGYTFAGWKNAEGEVVTTVDTSAAKAITFTATWTANEYDINLFANIGDTEAYATVKVAYDTANYMTLVANPTTEEDGVTFAGWYNADGTRYVSSLVWSSTEALNLYAKWGTEVTFNYGDAENQIEGVVSKGAVKGEAWNWTDIETPVKVGYTFEGWYTTVGEQEVEVELEGEAWEYDTVITLTAKFTVEQYYYKTSPRSYFGEPIAYGENFEPFYQEPGYNVVGWVVDVNENFTIDEEDVVLAANGTWDFDGDVEATYLVLAVKEVVVYNITYVDAYGGTLAEGAEYVTTYTVEDGDYGTVDISGLKLTKYGYNFLGWRVQGTEEILTSICIDNFLSPVTWTFGDITLEAVWEVSQDEGWTKNY